MLRPNHTFVNIHPRTKDVLRLLARELDIPLKHTLDTVIRHYVACHGIDLLRAVGDRSLLAELELRLSGEGNS